MHIEIKSKEDVEIVIRSDGKVIWIYNVGDCICRVTGIEGTVHVDDRREKQEEEGG